jgi:hypothetical protein
MGRKPFEFFKIRPIVKTKIAKTYGITIPSKIAIPNLNLEFKINVSGNCIILESGKWSK